MCVVVLTVALHHVMYCYVLLCYAMLCFVMLCNAMQFNVMHVYIYIQNLVAIIPSMACGYHF